jgi:RNA polymerase sigma-70 factor, ECF subfamily
MHFRKKALRQISLDEPFNQDARLIRREYGSQDDRLSGSVDRIALTRAIRELPAGYRTIFLLHEVEGYEHQEIAQLLDCSVGNSKSQLHKAKLRIRELLGHARQAGKTEDEQVPARRRSARNAKEELRAAMLLEKWNRQLERDEVPTSALLPNRSNAQLLESAA